MLVRIHCVRKPLPLAMPAFLVCVLHMCAQAGQGTTSGFILRYYLPFKVRSHWFGAPQVDGATFCLSVVA